MNAKSPHVIVITALTTLAHNTQAGAEALSHMMPWSIGSPAKLVSEAAAAVVMWLLVFHAVPFTLRLIVKILDFIGESVDRCCIAGTRQTIRILSMVVERLKHSLGD
ncbi:hypothetical protein [Sphingomonas sp. Root710]|uniref:hypothetical protein n=1 Tax=Sphingomonas sp. Root710 TaxID=1736594 RepID=UPI000ADEA7C2|nr:hypothetical protein [Sphingomonas sp. Root710]